MSTNRYTKKPTEESIDQIKKKNKQTYATGPEAGFEGFKCRHSSKRKGKRNANNEARDGKGLPIFSRLRGEHMQTEEINSGGEESVAQTGNTQVS